MRQIAYVSYTFHLDPVVVARDASTLNRLVRLAAHELIQDELERQNKAAARKR